ncbi:hypothetical protein TIFTF001_040458 [Ficus carica]|uniref:Uncharacterized protein n=1 Tax=Ficus carica TaxID=3494 RepID=A0AA88CJD0_FICCA|nr:hypothetical protein TIFTF001_040458 [Ficus carica]
MTIMAAAEFARSRCGGSGDSREGEGGREMMKTRLRRRENLRYKEKRELMERRDGSSNLKR